MTSAFDDFFTVHAMPELKRIHGDAFRYRTQSGGKWGPWTTVADALVSVTPLEGLGEPANRTAFIVTLSKSVVPTKPTQIEINGQPRRVVREIDSDDARSPGEWNLYVA